MLIANSLLIISDWVAQFLQEKVFKSGKRKGESQKLRVGLVEFIRLLRVWVTLGGIDGMAACN